MSLGADLPHVSGGVTEAGGAHTPGPVHRPVEQGDPELLELGALRVHVVDLEAWQHSPSYVESLLAEAGAPVQVRVVREPLGVEKTRQAYLLATVATT